MWESLVRVPQGSNNLRKFSRVLATFLVACFGYIFATAPSAHAADATWSGDSIVYQDRTYERTDSTDNMPGDVKASPAIYQHIDDTREPNLVYFIYFADTVAEPKDEKEATYIRYTLNPPNRYVNPTPEDGRSISLEPVEDETASQNATSCNVATVGWLVCGVAGWIADAVDEVYSWVALFLTVQPLTTESGSSLYNLWDIVRNFANIMFVIGFMVVIYSYLVGGGFNGYEIRKILPRIVLAAILINISFWICSLAIDVSNIVGISLQDMLINVRENSVALEENRNVGWGEMTTYILSGGTIGTIAFLSAAGGSFSALAFMLVIVLITVIFSLLVAFIILAARQAILIMLVILSPLAFAAFILPNTEKWFDRWRGIFTTLLVLFPIFSLLFGGSQLAGAAIIQNAPDGGTGMAIMLFGMAVQIVPLVITPFLIQFSGGLIGRIAGIVNNSEKGIADRSKNWARDRAEMRKQHNLQKNPADSNRFNLARRGAQRMYAKDLARKKRLESYQKGAENLAHDREFGNGRIANSRLGRAAGLPERLERSSYGYWDSQYRDAELAHQRSDAQHEQHWKQRSNQFITDPNDPSKRILNKNFDQNQYDQRIALQTARDQSQLADDRMTTAYTEMKAGRDPSLNGGAGPSTQQAMSQINKAQTTARDLVIEANRKASAEVVIQQAGAAALKESLELRELAGGIGGDAAASRIYAKAKVDVVSAYMDDVKNSRSVLSDYTAKQLVKLHVEGIDRDGRQVYNPETGAGNTAIVDAAMQEIMLNKGNNWAFQKLRDRTADMGMIYEYDEATNTSTYYDLARDASGNVIRDRVTGRAQKGVEIKDPEVIDRRRDAQQLFADAAKQSKLRVANLSATEISNFETGVSSTSSQEAIIRDVVMGKFDQAKIVDMDVDELQRMVQVLRQNDVRDYINDQDPNALSQLMTVIDGAQANKQINGRIKDRERGVMNAIASYLDPREVGRSDIESRYWVDPANDNVRVPAGTPGARDYRAPVVADADYIPTIQN